MKLICGKCGVVWAEIEGGKVVWEGWQAHSKLMFHAIGELHWAQSVFAYQLMDGMTEFLKPSQTAYDTHIKRLVPLVRAFLGAGK
jgi:hypothetical protein